MRGKFVEDMKGDARGLWAQVAVQVVRFTLQKVGTIENVSDSTTKYHNEERLEALMRMSGLRFTRGLQHAASAVTPSQTIAANAILRTQQTELDENIWRF